MQRKKPGVDTKSISQIISTFTYTRSKEEVKISKILLIWKKTNVIVFSKVNSIFWLFWRLYILCRMPKMGTRKLYRWYFNRGLHLWIFAKCFAKSFKWTDSKCSQVHISAKKLSIRRKSLSSVFENDTTMNKNLKKLHEE